MESKPSPCPCCSPSFAEKLVNCAPFDLSNQGLTQVLDLCPQDGLLQEDEPLSGGPQALLGLLYSALHRPNHGRGYRLNLLRHGRKSPMCSCTFLY